MEETEPCLENMEKSRFRVVLENKVWFLGQQSDAEVRTPCAACSLQSQPTLGLGSMQSLGIEEHANAARTHTSCWQLIALSTEEHSVKQRKLERNAQPSPRGRASRDAGTRMQ